jgi:hypothetical protein
VATATDPRVQEQVLTLYVNLGLSHGEVGHPTEEIQQYQRGLDLATTAWQVATATDPGVQKLVLRLYDNYIATLANNGDLGAGLRYLPLITYLLWQVARDSARPDWQNPLTNFRIWLAHLRFPTDLTRYFQDFLHNTLLTQWYPPARPHPYLTTDTLLRLSEGCYLLEQATERQWLTQTYQALALVSNPQFNRRWQTEVGTPQHTFDQRLQQLWQTFFPRPRTQLKLPFTTRFECDNVLATLPRWQSRLWRVWQKRAWHALQELLPRYRQLFETDEKLKNQARWDSTLTSAQDALVAWLHQLLLKVIPLPERLTDPGAIVLGVIWAYLSKAEQTNLLNQAGETNCDTLPLAETVINEILVRSQLLTWASANLDSEIFGQTSEVFKTSEVLLHEHFIHPPTELSKALQQWQAGQTATLTRYLTTAWQTAQTRAESLARLLTAFTDKDLTQRLDAVIQRGSTTPTARQQALTAWVTGKASIKLRDAIGQWLGFSGHLRSFDPMPVIANLKQRFDRVLRVYPKLPHHSRWSNTVHRWATIYVQELLTETPPALATLWETLERSRIAFTGLTTQMQIEAWEEHTGTALMQAFQKVATILTQDVPAPQQPFPPLTTWLTALDRILPPSPSVADCQAHLAPHEALLQPFFDPEQQRLRILWLDQQHGLELRDLPDTCARQSVWTDRDTTPARGSIPLDGTGIIDQWTRGMLAWKEEARQGRGRSVTTGDWWETILHSAPVQTLAHTLHQWANDDWLTQLTLIWPAPLGQLPWEALPQLADTLLNPETLLVREVSLRHWLDTSKATPAATHTTPWVISDPSGQQYCMIKEARWVAQHFYTTPDSPCPSFFDALQQLQNHHHAHLATHGEFNRQDPLESYLSLDDGQRIHFPLWLTTTSPVTAELIVLSACESNLSGPDTAGLLTPVGIGPSLAAAGAQTIVGTLWPCEGLVATYFSYYFYQLAAEYPNTPWHHIVAEARQKVRKMHTNDVKAVATQMNLYDQTDECYQSVDYYQADTVAGEYPFTHPYYWAGFVVLGKVGR